MNKSAELKKRLLTASYSIYAKKYNEWKDKYHDDRRLFQNMYEYILESLEVMCEIENNYIWTAFNKQFTKDLKVMDDIITRFDEIKKAL